MIMKRLVVVFSFLVFLCVGCGQANAKTVTLSACNAAPYKTEAVFRGLDGTKISNIVLPPGQCSDFNIDIPQDGAAFYSRAIPSQALSRLKEYSFFRRGWGGSPVFSPSGSSLSACLNSGSGVFKNFNKGFGCQKNEKLEKLAYVPPDADNLTLFSVNTSTNAVTLPSGVGITEADPNALPLAIALG